MKGRRRLVCRSLLKRRPQHWLLCTHAPIVVCQYQVSTDCTIHSLGQQNRDDDVRRWAVGLLIPLPSTLETQEMPLQIPQTAKRCLTFIYILRPKLYMPYEAGNPASVDSHDGLDRGPIGHVTSDARSARPQQAFTRRKKIADDSVDLLSSLESCANGEPFAGALLSKVCAIWSPGRSAVVVSVG